MYDKTWGQDWQQRLIKVYKKKQIPEEHFGYNSYMHIQIAIVGRAVLNVWNTSTKIATNTELLKASKDLFYIYKKKKKLQKSRRLDRKVFLRN